LKFLYENYHFDCINISFGLSFLKYPEKMINIFNSFEEKNCKIFAAFNNDGSISYPAIFKNVVGVASKNNIKNSL